MSQRDHGNDEPSRQRSLPYMPELDGLRAVAVLGVLLFHFGIPGFAGGYIGVDVFFVLSGFLITKILVAQREAGGFSFLSFYLNRFWRLFPALLITTLLSFLTGALLFSPYFFEPLAESSLAALFSLSNFYFWSLSGYFDQDAITKPLLHTWSLSVEEQFYLVWPLLVAGAMKLESRASRVLLVTLVGLASLIAAEWFIETAPSASFYLMPFRIFEFSAGALVSLLATRDVISSKWINDLLFAAGLAVLLACFTLFDDQTRIPGMIAIIPCAAVALILVTGASSRLRIGLANRYAVYVGRISYSLYLVHWPVVSFFTYLFVDTLTPVVFVAMTLTTFALAHWLHSTVELPFRNRQQESSFQHRHRGALVSGLCVAVTLPAAYVWAFGDLPGRYEPTLTADQIEQGKQRRFQDLHGLCRIDTVKSQSCFDGDDSVILVIGNSHEPDAVNAVAALLEDQADVEIVYFGSTNHCGMSLTEGLAVTSAKKLQCEQRAAMLNDPEFIRRIDHVVYTASHVFSGNKTFYAELIQAFRRVNPNVGVTVFGDYIYTSMDCAELINRFGRSSACSDPLVVTNARGMDDHGPYRQTFVELGANIVSKWDLLCQERRLESCETETPEGVPMHYDRHHLSYEFARHLGSRMKTEGYQQLFLKTSAPENGFSSRNSEEN